MVELDEVDLAKTLTMLSKLLARTAADIVIELDSPERHPRGVNVKPQPT
jgi:transcriptional accessory protein Tex/SPT6